MAFGDKGTLFVGTRAEGKGQVYAILDKDQNGIPDDVITFETGLLMPNGVAFRNGSLYLAEVSILWRYDDIERNLFEKNLPLKKTIVRDNWPKDTHHGWKYLRFGPKDDLLYVPVGAPCNVCLRSEKRYATIMTIDVHQQQTANAGDEIFSEGIRNSVGFDFHPVTNELWFTENGRDFASEEIPPDELNSAPRKGLHYGYPHCFGKNTSDPETNQGHDCNKYEGARKELDPHVAAIGMRFYTGKLFPDAYKNNIFVCEHGSWNRQKPLGYRVMLATLNNEDNRSVVSYEPFMTGFIQDGIIKGRPVDVITTKYGSLLVSDDHAHKIYKVSYQK